MKSKQTEETDFFRRRFMQAALAGASIASLGGMLAPGIVKAETSPKRKVPFPKFKVQTVNKTAAEIYQCKPDLKRFGSENMAFKIVSEELKGSSAKAMAANMIGNIKEGEVGHRWPVKNQEEARMYYALNVAMTTWNEEIGPYGENRENRGYLSWLPKDLPEKLTSSPMPLENVSDVTKKIKVIASYAGADKVGITKLDRRWVFNSVCLNGLDPGPPKIKHIVFKKVDQPKETDTEFVIPDSVQNAIVFINVQPRALTQIAPFSCQYQSGLCPGRADRSLSGPGHPITWLCCHPLYE